jgi:hypothetical protein
MIDAEGKMARGEKSKYSEKQKRQAEHIEEDYEEPASVSRRPSAAPGRP